LLPARLDPLSRITGFTIWPETEFPKTTTLKIRKYLVKDEIRKGRGGEGNGQLRRTPPFHQGKARRDRGNGARGCAQACREKPRVKKMGFVKGGS